MGKIIVVNVCSDCPHWTDERHHTADPFEMSCYWICKREEKVIRCHVETFDERPGIPDWCPLSDFVGDAE